MWSEKVKTTALVACGRRCCVCHRFCGLKIELHHIDMESEGGASDIENCIPLCFDCHCDAGHYNSKHPKGTKYSPRELRSHRDVWYETVKTLELLEANRAIDLTPPAQEVYEDQTVTLKGFVWRESFAGPPNYESFETDTIETYWMLVLPTPIIFYSNCLETGQTIKYIDVKKLQLCVAGDFYLQNQDMVRKDVELTGQLFPSVNGHHNGDANFYIINPSTEQLRSGL